MSYEENLKSLSHDSDATIAMYTGFPGQPGSAVPNGGKQYCALKLTGKNQVGLALAADVVYGVLQNKPQRPGQAATVAYEGVSNVVAGGVIAVGATLIPDANGRWVSGTTVAGSKRVTALAPAAGVGELIPAMIA